MSVRAFQNWTPESSPCPRCGVLLPAAGTECRRCGAPAAASSAASSAASAATSAALPAAQPVADAPAWTAPHGYQPSDYAVPQLPAEFGVVRPARRGPRPALVAAVIAAVALVSFGGYELLGTGNHASSGSGALASGSTQPSTAPTAAGRLSLSAVPLSAADLPGWQRSKPDANNDDSTVDARMARCLGVAEPPADHGPSIDTKYVLGPYQVISSAQRMHSLARVEADTALLRNPRMNTCVSRVLRGMGSRDLPNGVRLDSFRLRYHVGAQTSPVGVVGTASGRMIVSGHGRTVIVYLGMAFIASGRIESELDFFGTGGPVDESLQSSLIATVAARTAEAG